MSDQAGARSRESDPRGALSGVAGGELLVPTIVLLYGVDIKLRWQPVPGRLPAHHAVAFARYSRDQAFDVLRGNGPSCSMAPRVHQRHLARGSLLGAVPILVLIPILKPIPTVGVIKLPERNEGRPPGKEKRPAGRLNPAASYTAAGAP